MQYVVKLSLLGFFGILITMTGCASQKTQRQLNALQGQVAVITDELVRLDEGLHDVRGAVQTLDNQQRSTSRGMTFTPSAAKAGSVYRTPSGFQLPSISIQQALKSAGYYRGSLDGKIGSGTKSAIQSFQRDHGLTADGVVGRQTWDKLKVYLSGTLK